MLRRAVFVFLMIAISTGAQQRRRVSLPPPSVETSLAFFFDSGFRVLNATNPAPGIDPAAGTFYLYYTDHLTGRQNVITSNDGLTFGSAAEAHDWPFDPRNTLMPDGKTWRRYQWNLQTHVMQSSSSTDGAHFTNDSGTRYTPQAQDANTIGVYDAFSDRSGGVVLLYIGDMFGLNNVRRAYSRDNGLAFTFDRGNILGDADQGGGPNSYVDEKSIRLPDGRIRLFVMRQNVISSFTSNDDGYSFARDPGARLERGAFSGATLTTLNDPVVVRLADGRYRMYVASLRNDNVWVIVSATTK